MIIYVNMRLHLNNKKYEVGSYHGGGYEDVDVLDCNTLYVGRYEK